MKTYSVKFFYVERIEVTESQYKAILLVILDGFESKADMLGGHIKHGIPFLTYIDDLDMQNEWQLDINEIYLVEWQILFQRLTKKLEAMKELEYELTQLVVAFLGVNFPQTAQERKTVQSMTEAYRSSGGWRDTEDFRKLRQVGGKLHTEVLEIIDSLRRVIALDMEI